MNSIIQNIRFKCILSSFLLYNAWDYTQLLPHNLKLEARNYGHILFGRIIECLIGFISIFFAFLFSLLCFCNTMTLIGMPFGDTLSRKRSHYTYVLNNGQMAWNLFDGHRSNAEFLTSAIELIKVVEIIGCWSDVCACVLNVQWVLAPR